MMANMYNDISSSSYDNYDSDSDSGYYCSQCHIICVKGRDCYNCHIIKKRMHTDETDCICYSCDEMREREYLDKLPHGKCISCECISLKFFMTADTYQIAPLCANCILVLINNHLEDDSFPIELIVRLISEKMRIEAFCTEYLDYILPYSMNTDEQTLFSFLPRELFSLIRDNIYCKDSDHNYDLIEHKSAIKLEIIEADWVLKNYKYNDVDLERFAKSGFFYGRINGYDTLPWYMGAARHRGDGMPAIVYGDINIYALYGNVDNVDFDGNEENIMEDYTTDDDIPELVSGITC